MPKASEVANELRKLADSFDREPDAEIVKPFILFDTFTKDVFLALARIFPRPYDKKVVGESTEWPKRELRHTTPAIHLWATCPLANTCTLVSPAIPAKYECEPLLSDEEESALGGGVAA